MNKKIAPVLGESIFARKSSFRMRGASGAGIGDKTSSIRLGMLKMFLIFGLLAVSSRMFYLTIVRGSYFRSLSDENRIREKYIPAPRGVIKDRNGEVLVLNKPQFGRELSHEEALELEIEGKVENEHLGVTRDYVHPYAFTHLIGLVGMVAENEVGSLYCGRKLTMRDTLGRTGIEKTLDCQLSGSDGKELVETDAQGAGKRVLSKILPLVGEEVSLSIDKLLQIKAYELMKDKKGAVIAHNPKSGEIYALFSSPSYDISKFAEGISKEEYENLLSDKTQPLFNRAISGTYPPGSTFKIVVASAGLEEKVIDRETKFEDTGTIRAGYSSFSNWYFTQYGKTEGPLGVVDALRRSNDIFFYKLGESLGQDKIARWARKFKLGTKLGVEIEGEEEGIVPDTAWKQSVLGEQWYLGDTYHYAIGQGSLSVTPLQISFMTAAIANRGIICKPTLYKDEKCENLTGGVVSRETLELITTGMVAACSPGGTAYPLFDFKVEGRPISVACKTGTAEYGDPQNLTHAWLTAFAPADDPEIVVTVLVEEGGEGSRDAAPIVKEILTEWFRRKVVVRD